MDQMGSLTQTSMNGADTSFSKPETTVLCYDTQQLPHTSTNTAESSQKRIEPYLNRAFLLILVLGFMVMIAALETLAWLSKRNQGLATANEDWHYLWTYGPTMILALPTAVWDQIEYRTKRSLPWRELRRGPLPAQENILLNYLSPNSIVSLFKSFRAGHYFVAIGILGSFTLRLLTIASTSLLTLRLETMTTPSNFTLLDDFHLERGRRSLGETLADPAITMWAIFQRNQSYPPGVTPELATQTFVANEVPDEKSLLSASIKVFQVHQSCETFRWTSDSEYWPPSASLFVTSIMPKQDQDKFSRLCRVNSPTVPAELSTVRNMSLPLVDCARPDKMSVFFQLVLLEDVANQTHQISVSAILCYPSYSLVRREVTTTSSGSTGKPGAVLTVAGEAAEQLDLGMRESDLTDLVLNNFPRDWTEADSDFYADPWMTLINWTSPRPDWRDFTKLDFLSHTFQRAFTSFATLMVKTSMTRPTYESLQGFVTHQTARLVVSPLSLRLMEGLLGSMCIYGIILCLYNLDVRPPGSGSLLDLAEILARSQTRVSSLMADGGTSNGPLSRRLHGYLFSVVPETNMLMVQDPPPSTLEPMQTPVTTTETSTPKRKWWQPLATTWGYRASVAVISITMVIALEVLYQKFNNGTLFIVVSSTGYTKYSWLFLPTAAMACLSLAYGAMDSAARTLHQYRQLRFERQSGLDSLTYDPTAAVSPVALWHAARRRQFELSVIILTSILGPFLAIVASGLYAAPAVTQNQDVTIDIETWFEFDNAVSMGPFRPVYPYVGIDSLSSQAVLFNNVSYPPGTYDTLSFATFDSTHLKGFGAVAAKSNLTAVLNVRLPAARGQMNCTVYAYGSFNRSKPDPYGFNRSDPDPYRLIIDPPPGCTRPDGGYVLSPGDYEQIKLQRDYKLWAQANYSYAYYGHLAIPSWVSVHPNTEIGNRDPWQTNPYFVCADGAQHLFAMVARPQRLVQTLHCMPYIEKLEVDVTLDLRDLSVLPSKPPREVPESTRPWGDTNQTRNSVQLGKLFTATLSFDESSIDAFFFALIEGEGGTPVKELLPQGNSTDVLIAKMNRLYQRMIAQSLHANFRRPSTSIPVAGHQGRPAAGEMGNRTRIGSVTDGSQLRLTQSLYSTRGLQALLVAMMLCAGVSVVLERRHDDNTTRILPMDPGPLAARMALLAGSRFVERLRQGGQDQEHLLEDENLALRWWDPVERRGRRRYGIDIQLPSDDTVDS